VSLFQGGLPVWLWLGFKLLTRVVAEQIVEPEPGLAGLVSARDHEHGPVAQLVHDRARVRLAE
jgi:hypothetical protein